MEAVELDDAAARKDRRHRRERKRVHVAERQRRDEALDVGNDLGQLVQAEVPLAGAPEVAVGEAAALRLAGRARCVEQRALGVAIDRLALEARRRARRRDPADDFGTDRLQVGADLGCRGAQSGFLARLGDGERDLAVADQVLPLGRAHVGMDRHDADAERVERQPVGEEGGPVLEQQADAMAVAVAGLGVVGAQPLDLAGDLAPAARAWIDRVAGGRHGLDAQELGVAAARGSAGECGIDGGHRSVVR